MLLLCAPRRLLTMVNASCQRTVVCILLMSFIIDCCHAIYTIHDRKVLYMEQEPARQYRLEDFLWTGSGDGEPLQTPSLTTTVVWTTTVLATIYPTATAPTCPGVDCPISPTPVLPVGPSATPLPPWPPPWAPPPPAPDPAYWLVTVLHTNTTDWVMAREIFQPRLARLYSTAFQRQQWQHLGQVKRRRDSHEVEVTVHNATVSPGTSALELVYSVRVAGRLVPAGTAAQDMRLLTDTEVIAELGYPLLTKAEPYLKSAELGGVSPPVSPSPRQDLILFLVAGASAILLLVILIALFVLGFGRHKRKQRVEGRGSANRTRVFEREQSEEGEDNMAYRGDEAKVISPDSPSRLSARSGGSSEASLVRRSPCAPQPKPRTQKPTPSAVSPNSYLSMPSVRAFPRGPVMTGPLELVLENPGPLSPPPQSSHLRASSSEQDPGVIGPLVWDLHCHRLQKQDSVDLEEDVPLTPGVGRMRRRFQELLDDAFSLFGSRGPSPEVDSTRDSPTNTRDARVRSALVRPSESLASEVILRPKTTDSRRPATAGVGNRLPRGAWGGTTPTTPPARPQPRPLSAGPFHKPCLEPGYILSNATLPPNDPAVPLIAAIRQELGKFVATKPYDV